MHYSLEELMAGNREIVGHYQRANAKWQEFFQTHRALGVKDWAQWLTDQQLSFFEHQCGGRLLGQEVMAWSGFATLYSTQVGFENNRPAAKRLVQAFAASMCSLEVKSHARAAALSYHLDDEEDLRETLRLL